MEKVGIRIKQPILWEWICPKCHKINRGAFTFSPIGIKVQCDFCDTVFISEKEKGG